MCLFIYTPNQKRAAHHQTVVGFLPDILYMFLLVSPLVTQMHVPKLEIHFNTDLRKQY